MCDFGLILRVWAILQADKNLRREKAAFNEGKFVEPTGGFEPPTCGLRNRCSTD